MNLKPLLIGLGISALLLQTNSVLGGQEEKGAESATITAGGQASVAFPHGRHQKVFVDCKPCHELFPKKARGIEQMKAEGKLQAKQVMAMCQNCHQNLIAKGEKAGPTACKECHKG